MPMESLWFLYFTQTGLGWAVIGAMAAVALGGLGSAAGIRTAACQGAGVLAEFPDLFAKLLVLIALPGTQAFYGFICAVMIALRTGLIAGGAVTCPPLVGLCLMAVGVGMGVVQYRSAVHQGETSAAAINLVAHQPDQAGRALILPALVETYAIVALLAAILMILWLTQPLGLAGVPAG